MNEGRRGARHLDEAGASALEAGREAGAAVRSAISAVLGLGPGKRTPPRASPKPGAGKGKTPARKTDARKIDARKSPADKKAFAKGEKAGRKSAGATAPFVAPIAPITALGWFMLAGVILAWPRERPAPQRIREGLAEGPSGWLARWRKATATPQTDAKDAAAREPGRGREAERPSAIPPRGWRDIFSRTWTEFNQDRITAVAGGITFFALLAMFPAISAFVSLYGLFADRHAVVQQVQLMRGVIPGDALKFVADQMLRVAEAPAGALGLTFFTSLLVSLWSANAGVKALFDGLNIAYDEREKRGFFRLTAVSLGFTVASIAFLVVALSLVVAVPVALNVFGLRALAGGPLVDLLRWPALWLGATFALACLYRFGPSRAQPRWRWLTWGSGAAAILWLLVSMLFSWYVGQFGSYNKTYGSLGAVVGFLTWLWISTIVVLFGAELNAEMEHQTARDTTTGAPRRMGTRGATVADTLGVATAAIGRTFR